MELGWRTVVLLRSDGGAVRTEVGSVKQINHRMDCALISDYGFLDRHLEEAEPLVRNSVERCVCVRDWIETYNQFGAS